MADTMANTWGKVENITAYFSLREQNNSLVQENARLMNSIRSLAETVNPEDTTWHNKRTGFSIMPAYVVAKNRNSLHNYIIVDRGWEDKVCEGDGIVTSRGVIGVVQGVSRHYSIAISLDNPEMNVSAKIGKEGFVGNMSFDASLSNKAMLTGIPLHAEVSPGDTIYTSGFSSMFPADIPLAVVSDSKTSNGIYTEISLDVFENFSKVHHVYIVRNKDREELEELQR